jgi:TonB family protein
VAFLSTIAVHGQNGGKYDVEVFPQDSLTSRPIFPGCQNPKDIEEERLCTEYSIVQFVMGNARYPKDCREAGISGTVYVACRIDDQGWVQDQQCIRGVYHSMDSAACATIGQLPKFAPGKIGDIPVSSEFVCPVRFAIK